MENQLYCFMSMKSLNYVVQESRMIYKSYIIKVNNLFINTGHMLFHNIIVLKKLVGLAVIQRTTEWLSDQDSGESDHRLKSSATRKVS